jgi:hypothetical protein
MAYQPYAEWRYEAEYWREDQPCRCRRCLGLPLRGYSSSPRRYDSSSPPRGYLPRQQQQQQQQQQQRRRFPSPPQRYDSSPPRQRMPAQPYDERAEQLLDLRFPVQLRGPLVLQRAERPQSPRIRMQLLLDYGA